MIHDDLRFLGDTREVFSTSIKAVNFSGSPEPGDKFLVTQEVKPHAVWYKPWTWKWIWKALRRWSSFRTYTEQEYEVREVQSDSALTIK